ncbi:AraC family transcriptional regulator [Streptomyces sp. NPDC052040]|uniref:AraC family transcriptional regulator n=1 Tax=Streptomyces sp. NPDC052040 TaxID=3365682 RepID=UPI0037D089DC
MSLTPASADTRSTRDTGAPAADGPLRGGPPADERTLGFLRIRTVRGTAGTSVHEPGCGAVEPGLLLGFHSLGRALLLRRGTTEECGPDDLFVCDGGEPFALHEPEDFTLHLVRVPRRVLALGEDRVRALCDRPPFGDGAVAPLLLPLLRELVGAPEAYTPRTALRLAGGVAEWAALLAVENLDTGPRDPGARETGARDTGARETGARDGGPERHALVRRVRAHVDAQLWDRDLTPAAVAASQHISIRYLHKLFEDHHSTIGRWIQHRRLEEARRELARPGRDDTTVSAVARRWGFANATHFSRSFRAVYGMSPSDWRDHRTRVAGEEGRGGRGPKR